MLEFDFETRPKVQSQSINHLQDLQGMSRLPLLLCFAYLKGRMSSPQGM